MRFPVLLSALAISTIFVGSCLSAQFNSPNPMSLLMQARGGSYLGVQLKDIDGDRANVLKLGEARGVEVAHVEEGCPAAEAGLKAGDVLLSYNGETIIGAQQLGRLVSETPRGRRVTIQYWRDGKTQTATVKTGAPPSAAGWNFPGDTAFNLPDFKNFMVTDTPNPMLIWKNSMLGIECEALGTQLQQYFGVNHGVLVRSVDKGSRADKAGVKAGDVLLAVGDRSISAPRDLSALLRELHPERHASKSVTVELSRDRKPVTLGISISGEQE